jgi:hypothetical protein
MCLVIMQTGMAGRVNEIGGTIRNEDPPNFHVPLIENDTGKIGSEANRLMPKHNKRQQKKAKGGTMNRLRVYYD